MLDVGNFRRYDLESRAYCASDRRVSLGTQDNQSFALVKLTLELRPTKVFFVETKIVRNLKVTRHLK